MQEQIDRNIEREMRESSTIDFENKLSEIINREIKLNKKETKKNNKKDNKSDKSNS